MSFSEDGCTESPEADCTIAAEGLIHQATTVAAGHQRTQEDFPQPAASMRHRWPSRRGSESARMTALPYLHQ